MEQKFKEGEMVYVRDYHNLSLKSVMYIKQLNEKQSLCLYNQNGEQIYKIILNSDLKKNQGDISLYFGLQEEYLKTEELLIELKEKIDEIEKKIFLK